jgi:DNA-binding transcriptional regulator YbjK
VSRREEALAAAVLLLGDRGMRHLTHRAVDERAGLPAGSTSNSFRTRDALVAAVITHLATRERAVWEASAAAFRPDSPAALAEALTAFCRRMTGPDRVLTLARYAVFVEAAVQPGLRRPLAENEAQIRAWGAHWLRAIGSHDPDRDCRLVLNQLDGILLHQLVFPDPDFDPLPQLTTLLRAVGGRP